MATSKRCKPKDLSALCSEILGDYSDLTDEAVEDAIDKTGEETAAEVESLAPVRTGEYKKSINFGYRDYKRTKGVMKAFVYSEAPSYRLTHLLENGHASRNGGRTVPPSPAGGHWAKGMDLADKKLVEHFKEALNKK